MEGQGGLRGVAWGRVRTSMLRNFQAVASEWALPADTWLVYEQIGRLVWYRGQNSPRGGAYAVASELWLGGRVGCRRETVSHHIWRLSNCGLLRVLNRARRRGRWCTNAYYLAQQVVAPIARASGWQREAPPTKPKLSVSPKESYACATAHTVEESRPGRLGVMLSRWLSRGGGVGA